MFVEDVRLETREKSAAEVKVLGALESGKAHSQSDARRHADASGVEKLKKRTAALHSCGAA